LSWIWIVPIVVENEDALPMVPLMATELGTERASEPAVSVAVTVESAQTPPGGAVQAYAAGATVDHVTVAPATASADTSLAGDMDLSGRAFPFAFSSAAEPLDCRSPGCSR
jgi:hypothetical protein